MKTLQEKIEELEKQGWVYDDDFRVTTHISNNLRQLRVLKKGNEYREINSKTKRILKAKKLMSEIECMRAGVED